MQTRLNKNNRLKLLLLFLVFFVEFRCLVFHIAQTDTLRSFEVKYNFLTLSEVFQSYL